MADHRLRPARVLRGGRTVVLLGTRGGEDWLTHPQGPLRGGDIYDMPGLDAESASTLAERILKRGVADPARREAIREAVRARAACAGGRGAHRGAGADAGDCDSPKGVGSGWQNRGGGGCF